MVRTLAGKPSGIIKLSDLHGKSNASGQLSGNFLTNFTRTIDSSTAYNSESATYGIMAGSTTSDPAIIVASAAITSQLQTFISSPGSVGRLSIMYNIPSDPTSRPVFSLSVNYVYGSNPDFAACETAVRRIKNIYVEGTKIVVPTNADLTLLTWAQDLGKAKTPPAHDIMITLPDSSLNAVFENYFQTLNRPPIVGFDI